MTGLVSRILEFRPVESTANQALPALGVLAVALACAVGGVLAYRHARSR